MAVSLWRLRSAVSPSPSLASALTTAALLGFLGALPLLPMALEPRILFFTMEGTDATGYVRAAESMVDGSYFAPRPLVTMIDVLYRPHQAWTNHLIFLQDRPVAFFLVGAVSWLGSVDIFQAYLVTGSIPLWILGAFFFFLAYPEGDLHPWWKRAAILAAATGLVLLTGIVANVYFHFLGHVWSITTATALAPALLIVAFEHQRRTLAAALALFAIALVALGIYDPRSGALTVAVGSVAWAVAEKRSFPDRIVVPLLAGAGAGVVASALAGTLERNLVGLLQPNYRLFREKVFTIDSFLVDAGFQMRDEPTIRLPFVALSALLLAGLFQIAPTTATGGEARKLPIAYALTLYASAVLVVLWLAASRNGWMALTMTFLVAAAQALAGALWLGAPGEKRHRWPRAVAAVLVAGLACGTLWTTWRWSRRAIGESPRSALITHDGLPRVERRLEELRPQVVWFEGNVQRWVLFYSWFRGAEWAVLAPFPLWSDGGGLHERVYRVGPRLDYGAKRVPGMPIDARLLAIYAATLHRPEVQGAARMVLVHAELEPPYSCEAGYCVEAITLPEVMRRATASIPAAAGASAWRSPGS